MAAQANENHSRSKPPTSIPGSSLNWTRIHLLRCFGSNANNCWTLSSSKRSLLTSKRAYPSPGALLMESNSRSNQRYFSRKGSCDARSSSSGFVRDAYLWPSDPSPVKSAEAPAASTITALSSRSSSTTDAGELSSPRHTMPSFSTARRQRCRRAARFCSGVNLIGASSSSVEREKKFARDGEAGSFSTGNPFARRASFS
mmetsp:Transcript_21079/g.54973  ORF Transcript_21079/g.54973 Transcript_21079/m.54973 type:complete len:200 (+) Transcript_21079:1007-1606(+)